MSTRADTGIASGGLPAMARPQSDRWPVTDPNPLPADRVITDLSEGGVAVRGFAVPVVDNTLDWPVQRQITGPYEGRGRMVKEFLPPHTRQPQPEGSAERGTRNLPLGAVRAGRSVNPDSISQFDGLGWTGFTPPDPTLAVGPDHVLTTVNMSIAWYSKSGEQQFSSRLNSAGNPGFFETVGAGSNTFDPKCFYDHHAGRFVVMALEVYTSTAYITFAVSDDSDPNGVWYKYRTDAAVNIDGQTFWWDYPGFGYDQDAYYVTGSLFGLSGPGFAGAGFRVIDKASVLNGETAQFWTLHEDGINWVQSAHHFGDNSAAFFISLQNDQTNLIHAIRNPVTSPSLVSTTVSVPSYNTRTHVETRGGGLIAILNSRFLNANWRDGHLYATQHILEDDVAKVRWYDILTNDWPNSGGLTLAQSGNVGAGGQLEAFFPALYSNDRGDLGLVFGTTSVNNNVGVMVTGRFADDPAGTMAEPVAVFESTFQSVGGRWGDYYDIALDPADGRTFWGIAETQGFGWDTRIVKFSLGEPCAVDLAEPFGVLDLADIGAFVQAFEAGLEAADLAAPVGVLDLADIQAFVAGFVAGCP